MTLRQPPPPLMAICLPVPLLLGGSAEALALGAMGLTVCGEKVHRFSKGFVTPKVL